MPLESPRHVPQPPGVLLITPWYGGTEGGVAVATEALAHGLIRAKGECVVLELADDGLLPRFRRGTAGERIVSIAIRNPAEATNPFRRTTARARVLAARLLVRAVVRRYGLQIAHFHYTNQAYGVLAEAAVSARLRTVATFHGSDVMHNLDEPSTRAVVDDLLQTCAAVTTVSGALGRILLERFPSVRAAYHMVHNAIPGDLAELAREADGSRDIDILFVGNLIQRKGVDVLIRALPRVVAAHPGVTVWVAGNGDERKRLEALADELGVRHAFTFLGRQSRTALASLYRRTRLLVVPSREEALGLVVLEGQSAGATVIASAVGGIPEIITHEVTGVLVPPDDPDALASEIIARLTDVAGSRALGQRGRESVYQSFAPDVMVAQYMEVYGAVLAVSA